MSKKRTDKSRPAARPSSSPTKRTRKGASPARSPIQAPDSASIEAVIARGDKAEMRRVAASMRRWLRDFQSSLDALKESVKELGG